MNPIVAWLKAIRFSNLIIIVITQYLMRWCIIIPFFVRYDLTVQVSELNFLLFVFATVLVAAAGYIINDYFDLKIDRINKPDRIIVGRYVKRRVAMGTHVVLNILAIGLSMYVSWQIGLWQLFLIHVIMMAAMWFYSTDFKYQFLTGNIVISFALALVPLSVVLFEIPAMVSHYQKDLLEHPDAIEAFKRVISTVFYWVLGFSIFGFLLSLARELTKDIEDIKGDKLFKCKTVPIKWGIGPTKGLIIGIYSVVAILLGVVQQLFLADNISIYYLIVLEVLILFAIYKISKAKLPLDFSSPSKIGKLIAFVGVCYALVARYIILNV